MTPAFSYEMVAEAFIKWFETQNGECIPSEEAHCRERIISQIKRFYPNEERLNQDAHRLIAALLKSQGVSGSSGRRAH
ncbi:hypothetical protein ACUH78_16885 [Thauera sp. ZXT1-4]|jgi:hypothetical protein|uniref:hypothetical protein n=1 Tax=Thauera sp. ZXT1-4 TaxID=3460294 RepID=UPI004040A623